MIDCSVSEILEQVDIPAALAAFIMLVWLYLSFEAKREQIRSQERLQMAERSETN